MNIGVGAGHSLRLAPSCFGGLIQVSERRSEHGGRAQHQAGGIAEATDPGAAGGVGGGLWEWAKQAQAQTIGDPDVTVTGNLTVNGTGNSSFPNGKVGVGTPAPFGPLEVVGYTTLTGNQSAILHRDAAQVIRFLTGLRNDFSPPDFILYGFLGGNWLFWSGRVGIGTPSPVFPLDVVGDIHLSGLLRAGKLECGAWPVSPDMCYVGNNSLNHSSAGNYALLQGTDGATYLNAAAGQIVWMRINNSTVAYYGGNVFAISVPTAVSGGLTINTGGLVVSGGNVGIGTPSPVFPLDVVGDIRCTGKLRGTDGAVGNKLGVGTDAPLTRLHVDNGTLQVGTTSGREGYIYMFNDRSESPGTNLILNFSDRFGFRESDNPPALHLDRFSSGWVTPAISIQRAAGYVGIANPNPQYSLDVAGSIHLTGTLEGTARKTYYDS